MNRLNNCNEYYSANLEIKKLVCRDLYLVNDDNEIYWVKHCGNPSCCDCEIPIRVIASIKRVLVKNIHIPGIDSL